MAYIFVTVAHKTGLDTRSIIVGIRGEGSRARTETRALLDYDAAHPPKVAQDLIAYFSDYFERFFEYLRCYGERNNIVCLDQWMELIKLIIG